MNSIVQSYQYNLNLINVKKAKIFIYKKRKIAKKVNLIFFIRNVVERRSYILSNFFYALKMLENITGNLPIFKKISIRTNNKKKLKKKSFVVIKSTVINDFERFVEYFLINDSYFKCKNIYKFKVKYRYLQEFYSKKYLKKLIINKNVHFKNEYIFPTLYALKIKRSKFFKNYRRLRKKNKKHLLNIEINSYFKLYFVSLLSKKLINDYKSLLFGYKYHKNKILSI